MIKKIIMVSALVLISLSANANEEKRINNNIINKIANDVRTYKIEQPDLALPQKEIKHSFDVHNERGIKNILRFISMNVNSGVNPEHLKLAAVFHGSSASLLKNNKLDKNVALLIDSGIVDVYVCGQTILGSKMTKSELDDRVIFSLSAMNAHTYLQGIGYSLNPF